MQPAPPKKRRGLIIGLSIAAAVVLLGGVGVAGVAISSGHSSSSKKLLHPDGLVSQNPSQEPSSAPPPVQDGKQHAVSVPASVDGYDKVTGNVADRSIAEMRAAMVKAAPSYKSMYESAKIGLYEKSGSPDDKLIFMGMSSENEPELGTELKARTPSEEADTFLLGTGISNATDFPPGPFGGVLRCGHAPVNGAQMSSCVWVDGSTFGAVLLPQTSDDSTTAKVSLALRTAAEH